ncbi:MAG: bestrophin family protein [Archangium sp.]|nr:bestrophin family protein [Archangium sp.]
MVIGEKLPWKIIFRLHAPWLGMTALVTLAAWVLTRVLQLKLPVTPVPFQIAGVALAIFLGFRNNSAYDRWWEARKLWGGIVNHSRTLGRQVLTLFNAPDADRAALAELQKRVLYRQMAWLQALKQQLRGLDVLPAIAPYLSETERAAAPAQKNVAAWLSHLQGVELAEASRRGWITEFRLEMIDRSLTELLSMQGGCERIKSTPIPTAYRVFTHRFTRVYISILPLGLLEQVDLTALPVLLGLSLAFLVLETLGRILEDPFTLNPNALALNAICRTVEINLRQQLGETELPSPIETELVGNVPVLL